jgi:hypothetical protein
MSSPPPRPRTKEDLGFTPRKPVHWFSPPVLARTAARVLMSVALGEYLDKRELQQSLDAVVVKVGENDSAVWIDFVSDTADGFNSTYSVAWCVSQRHIRPTGHDEDLPRADLLILGGDEVYPYATAREYDDRFHGPYRSALPWTGADSGDAPVRHPRLLAIPGNHDWYDGLTAFMRLFAQPGWVGGREVVQTRSYFAVDLPGPYWLWGIDVQSGAYVDTAQINYFLAAAEQMGDGDRLILCTAKPSWADVAEDPDAYRNLAYIERNLVPEGVTTILMLSGDKHHYARYASASPDSAESARTRLTAGGGGAFLSATHKLKQRVDVPRPSELSSCLTSVEIAETEPFALQRCYPDPWRSRWLSLRALAIGWFNPAFLVVSALLYLLLFVANVSSLPPGEQPLPETSSTWGYSDVLVGKFGIATLVLVLILWGMLATFFDVPKRMRGLPAWLYRGAIGFVHTAAHVFALGAIALLALAFCRGVDVPLFQILTGILVCILGGVVGSVIFGGYLVLSLSLLNRHETEAFSAFRHDGYKNFIRMRVTRDEVTLYPIGIDRVCAEWTYDADNPNGEASHLKPADTIATRLIEAPCIIR